MIDKFRLKHKFNLVQIYRYSICQFKGVLLRMENHRISTYRFNLLVLEVSLHSKVANQHIKLSFKIGPQEQSTVRSYPLRDSSAKTVVGENITLQTDVIENQQTKSYQAPKAILKIFTMSDLSPAQKLAGYVDITLGEIISQKTGSKLVERVISNCLDKQATVLYSITTEKIQQQAEIEKEQRNNRSPSVHVSIEGSPGNKHNNSSYLFPTIDGELPTPEPGRLLTKAINEEQMFPAAILEELRVRLAQAEEKLIQQRLITERYKERQKIMGSTMQELKQNFDIFRNQYEQKCATYDQMLAKQKELESAQQYKQKIQALEEQNQLLKQEVQDLVHRAMDSPAENAQIQNKKNQSMISILEEKLQKVRIQMESNNAEYVIREKYYEDELKVLEDILNSREAEIKGLKEKCDNRAKKYEVLKYKYKTVEEYEKLIIWMFSTVQSYILQQEGPGIECVELDRDLLKIPECIMNAYEDLLERLLGYGSTVSISLRMEGLGKEQAAKERMRQMTQRLRVQQQHIDRLSQALENTTQKLEEHQQTIEQLRSEIATANLTFGLPSTPRMEEQHQYSFSVAAAVVTKSSGVCEERMEQRLKELEEERRKQEQSYTNLGEELKYMKAKCEQLEKLVSQQDKKIAKLELQNQIHSQIELKCSKEEAIINRKLNIKERMIENLQMTIEQFQQDLEEIRQENEKLVQQIERVKEENENLKKCMASLGSSKNLKEQPNPEGQENAINNDILEQELRNLMESIDDPINTSTEEAPTTVPPLSSPSQSSNLNFRLEPTSLIGVTLRDIQEEMSRKLTSLSLEFLRMRTIRVSRCTSETAVEQTLEDFKGVRMKLEQANHYIESLWHPVN